MDIEVRVGRSKFWFKTRKDADNQMAAIQKRIKEHENDIRQLSRLHAEIKKAVEAAA